MHDFPDTFYTATHYLASKIRDKKAIHSIVSCEVGKKTGIKNGLNNLLRPTTGRHSLSKTPKVGPAHHNKELYNSCIQTNANGMDWMTGHFQWESKNYTTSRASTTCRRLVFLIEVFSTWFFKRDNNNK